MSDPKTTPVARMQAEGRNPGDGGETGAPDSAALHPGYGTNRPLNELADINPTVSLSGLLPESEVSFISMADASENSQWTNRQTRQLKEVRNGYTSFQDGDVLFAKITPCMENGKGCHATPLMNGVGFGSTEFHVLRAREGQSQRYIYHWTRSEELRHKAETMMTGSAGQRRVPTEFFSQFVVFSPAEAEQRRIAEILDTLDDAIQKTEQLIAKLKQIKQGLLHDLLTRGIDENGQLRDPIAHPEQFKDSVVGRIPRSWQIKPLREIAMKIQDGTHFSPASKEGPYRYITSRNIRFGFLDLRECGWISEVEHKSIYARCDVKNGDVLLTKDGANTGNAAINILEEEFSLLSSVAFIRFDPQEYSSQYFLQYLLSPVGQGRLKDMMSGLATTRLTLEKINTFSVLVPSLEEQSQIASTLERYDQRCAEEENTLAKLRLIKKGLMHDLLTGKVRVQTHKEQVASNK